MDKIEIDGLIFEDLGGCCPRQFDVYDKDGNYKAYIRYRYGCLIVYTEPLGNQIWGYTPKSKYPMQGDFNSDKQTMQYLKRIAKQINNYYYLLEHPKRRYIKKSMLDLKNDIFSKILYENLIKDIEKVDGFGLSCKYNKKGKEQ